MIIPRGLIFKTLLGVVAAGGIITPTVVFKKEISDLFNGKSEEDSVVENGESSDDDINSGSNRGVNNKSSSQITGGPQTSGPVGSGIPSGGPTKQVDDVDKLGIPKSCKAEEAKGTTKKTCQLTSDQLKNLKFETKDDKTPITVEGLTDNNTVTLEIEDKSTDKDNYPKDKKYTLKSTSDKVTIKNTKDGDIVLEKNKGVDFREKQNVGQLETVEDSLGIPKSCKADQAKNNSPQTCQLTQEQLGKIKFEPKDGSSITVSGLGTNDKVTLTISDESSSSEKANYPKGKKYNFKTASAQKTATISGTKGDNITINDKGIDFREKNENVLEKVTVVQPQASTTDSLGLPSNCEVNKVTSSTKTKSCELTEEQLKKVKFKDFDGKTGSTTVTSLTAPNNKIKLTISWDEDKSTYPDNKKYSFDNSKNNSEVKISKDGKNVTIAQKTESWFKNEGNKLSLVKTKLKEEKNKKMNEVNEELIKLGLSDLKLVEDDFKKADSVSFEQKKKALDKVAMKKIQFSEFNGAPTDISDWDDQNKKIELEFDYTGDTIYPKNMKFTFKNTSGKDITIKKDQKSLKFQNGKSETFKVVNSKLIRSYYVVK